MLERQAHTRGMVFFHCQNHDQAETLRWALYRNELKIDCLVVSAIAVAIAKVLMTK